MSGSTSTDSSRTSPASSSRRGIEGRQRSLSWQPLDQHFASKTNSPECSSVTATAKDIQRLEDIHHELLVDNLRLWECINVIRCNPRLNAAQVLRQLYSLTENDFFQAYPVYAQFQQTGHGALWSMEEGGGSRQPEKYTQHLRVHNNGLMRENARLLLCLDILNMHPERTADEAISHSFGLTDEDFTKHYPRAAQGSRLRSTLSKLKEEEKTRQRSRSLPGHFYNPLFGPRNFFINYQGPSCSNNNDAFQKRNFDPYPYPADSSVDPMQKENRTRDLEVERRVGSQPRRRQAPLDELYIRGNLTADEDAVLRSSSPRRRLISTPIRQPSPQDRTNSRARRDIFEYVNRSRDCSPDSSSIPYMVAQHPYNWATSNNSSVHQSPPFGTDHERRNGEECFLPEDNEEDGVVYRKQRTYDRLAFEGHPFSLSGVGLGKAKAKDTSGGPRIIYSEMPASAVARQSQDNMTGALNPRLSAVKHGPSQGTTVLQRKASKLPVPQFGKDSKRYLPTEARKAQGNPTGKINCLGRVSPSKALNRHWQCFVPTDTGVKISPERKRVEKSVTFKQNDFSLNTRNNKGRNSWSPSSSPRRSQFAVDNMTEKPKPMYYKPPSEKQDGVVSDGNSDEDDVCSPRKSTIRKDRFRFRDLSPGSISSHMSLPPGNKDWSPLQNRLSRSLSDGPAWRAHDESHNLTQSRHELIQLRDSLRINSEGFCNRFDSCSPDSLEKSSPERGSFETISSLPRQSKPGVHGWPVGKSKPGSLTTVTSLPRLQRRSSEFTFASHYGSQTGGKGSPRRQKSVSPPKTSDFLNRNKIHRTPTYRFQTISPKRKDNRTNEWVKDTSRHQQGLPLPTRWGSPKNENANRIPDLPPPSEIPECSKDKKERFPLLRHLTSTPEEESIVERLLQEKRRLDRKYSNPVSFCKSFSAPPSPQRTTSPEGNRELFYSYPELHTPDEDTIDIVVSGRDYPHLLEGDAISLGDGAVNAEALPESIDNLRREAEQLREETSKCRLCRQRRTKADKSTEEAFVHAYDHFGTFGNQDAKRKHPHSQKNKNCNCCCRSGHHSHWKSILAAEAKPDTTDEYSHETKNRLDRMTESAVTARRAFYDAPVSILGEVAFQLERRIIRQVFKGVPVLSEDAANISENDEVKLWTDDNEKRHRFYGFTVMNLPQKIRSDSRDSRTGKRNGTREALLLRRFQDIISFLRSTFGYHVHKHGKLCQELIKKYGLFTPPPDVATIARVGLHDFRSVRNHVIKLANPDKVPDIIILVDCLRALAQKEDKPILWFQ